MVCLALGGSGFAQGVPAGRAPSYGSSGISALMLSDVHLDPFYDPAKVKALVDAPVSKWETILGGPDSPRRAQDYAALQRACGAKGADASNSLFQSSLGAMKALAAHARFVTLSGDLIAHNFPCRFAAVVPGKSQSEYAAFVEKTIAYVMVEIRKAVPDAPVYASLGNNDSGCGDYRMDAKSDFLAAASGTMLGGLPPSEEKDRALADFAAGGYYSVTMAAPMQRTRLIVLNDLFMSTKYMTCEGKADPEAAADEIDWLKKELAEARQQKQKVWVMGHIPPGVDIYAMAQKMMDVCGGGREDMFLRSGKMADVLIANADEIRLAIFAHTHMDEMRLLRPDNSTKRLTPKEMIALKMVPSITPVHGNAPAFTVGVVNPATGTLADFTVYNASNATGTDATWSKEYAYSQAYDETAFAPLQVERLMTEFKDDPGAKRPASQAFIRYFYAGDNSGLIKPLWPEYVCALDHVTGEGFRDCVCAARH